MRFKKALPTILIVLGFISLFLIIQYRQAIKDLWEFNLEKARIYWDNFFYHASSEQKRKAPISLLEKETYLKLYIGEPFQSFSPEEWKEFWNIVYGAFPKESSGRDLPKRARQLTEEEIKDELAWRYPTPFAYFQKEQWDFFLSIILRR